MTWNVTAEGSVKDVRAKLRDDFKALAHSTNFDSHVAQYAERAVEAAIAILPEDVTVKVDASGSLTTDDKNVVQSSALTITVAMG